MQEPKNAGSTPFGVTPRGVMTSCNFLPNPARKQWVQKEILVLVAVQYVSGIEGLQSFLDRGCGPKAKLGPDRLRVNLRGSALGQCLQGCALASRKLLPEKLIISGLTGYESIGDRIHVGGGELTFVLQFGIIPQLMRYALYVIGDQVGSC